MSQATELIARQMAAGSANARVWADILYNVKLYGAKGDWNGTTGTDDTVSVQATIDAAIAAGGKAVFFPHGTYKVTALTNLSSVVLFGDNASFVGISDSISQIGKPISSLVYNVKDYGSKGDGTTDDTASIQSAINAAMLVHGEVFFPPGTYKVTATLTISAGVKLSGVDASTIGTTISMTTNNPLFMITSGCTIENLSLSGSLNATYTLQDGIYINNCNDVYVRNVFIVGFYNGVHIKETVFYTFFDNVRWYSAINAAIYGEGTSAPGYAIQINNCQVTFSNSPNYGFYFANAGSIIIDTLLFSPNKCTQGGVVFASNAASSGMHQISNSVIEGSLNGVPGLKLVGTVGTPIKYVFIANTYIAGDASVDLGYASDIFFDNCYFTGANDGLASRHAININNIGDNIVLTNCEFQVTNVPIAATTGATSIGIDITSPIFTGGFQFVYLANIAAAAIKRLTVSGGLMGSNAKQLDLPTYDKSKVSVNVPGYNKLETSGVIVMDGTGVATFYIPHGLASTPSFVQVQEGSDAAGTARIWKVERDATNIIVGMNAAPPVGTGTVIFYYQAKV